MSCRVVQCGHHSGFSGESRTKGDLIGKEMTEEAGRV